MSVGALENDLWEEAVGSERRLVGDLQVREEEAARQM